MEPDKVWKATLSAMSMLSNRCSTLASVRQEIRNKAAYGSGLKKSTTFMTSELEKTEKELKQVFVNKHEKDLQKTIGLMKKAAETIKMVNDHMNLLKKLPD